MSRKPHHASDAVEMTYNNNPSSMKPSKQANGRGTGPVDLDALFEDDDEAIYDDDDSLFSHIGHTRDEDDIPTGPRYFNNPHKRLLDQDASLIPGSPFSKPMNIPSNRPAEPLAIAKYASTMACFLTLGWIVYLVFSAIWYYNSAGRIVVEVILALLSFFGLFWNSYFIIGSIMKCFIPAKAFKTNTKYCSIIPETKLPNAQWLDVTIQIPVYKESLKEVLMPTLNSCMAARDHYVRETGSRVNIVICDDGMMAMLRDNFPAAEMLWKNICETQGRQMKLSQLLKRVPRASRRHLKGLRSKNVYEVFHRMVFYYHFRIGFVARSTVDRRGKFKKASNLNSHLRLALGAWQLAKDPDAGMSFDQALMQESHNEDGSRYVMFGNDIQLGHLICVNDADARMAETIILKTVPEFLNDKNLGFTQHATKTMSDQRNEQYFTKMLAVYTDALYQGHFLLSSILGCHPPLVGHSIFLRTEAVKQCGRMRTLRKAQRWLQNIGLPFLPVDQVGFSNLQAENRTEYWSESHVSEDFELMIHLYNLGFNGRYCAYPDTEFEEGITRTFDEEAGRHRKFALGAHELVFNQFSDMLGHGIFTPLFRTFLSCDIPSYYKIFLTAYLCSYTSGGAYLIVFTAAAVTRLIDFEEVKSLYAFSPASVIILNWVIYYVLGYFTFIVSILRMHYINNKLLFPEYRKKYFGPGYLIFVMIRYCMFFQFMFYSVATLTFYFLGSMDHLLSRPGIVGATNKDSITITRCVALWETIKFNTGSWMLALIIAGLAYATVLQEAQWDPAVLPTPLLGPGLFAGPAMLLALMCFVVPIIFNPYILGWPFLWRQAPVKKPKSKGKKRIKDPLGREIVDIHTFMETAAELQDEIERVEGKPDVELGSLATKDLRNAVSPSMVKARKQLEADRGDYQPRAGNKMRSIPESNDATGRPYVKPKSKPASGFYPRFDV
ncbi:hypothetical protein MPSEU_001043100 [Mayamaea pseudoterrestris]|nr:hypothetical protein MPSEU_001043100 [Mayamaea pseudoterrestris]